MGQKSATHIPSANTGSFQPRPILEPTSPLHAPTSPLFWPTLFDDSHAHTKPPMQGTCGDIFSRGNENHVEESYVIGLLGTR